MTRALPFVAALLIAPSWAAAQDAEPPVDDEEELGVETGPSEDEEELGVDSGPAEADADAEAAAEAEAEAAAEAEAEAAADAEEGDEDSAPSGTGTGTGTESAEEDAGASSSTLGWNDDRVLAWTLFGASVLVAAGGGILLAVGVDEINTIENASDGTRWADVAGSYDRAPIFTATGFVVMSVGAVGLIVGAALLAVHGEGGTWIEATVGPGSLGLRGRF